jgi:hypothetical protein
VGENRHVETSPVSYEFVAAGVLSWQGITPSDNRAAGTTDHKKSEQALP